MDTTHSPSNASSAGAPSDLVMLPLTRGESRVLHDTLVRIGALIRPARGNTNLGLTPDETLALIDNLDMIRRRLAAALAPEGGTGG